MSDKQWTYHVSEWSYDSATGAVSRVTLSFDDETKADYTNMFLSLTGAANGNQATTTNTFPIIRG